jgi:hypothetical protein
MWAIRRNTMGLFWKSVACVAVICGAATAWQVNKAKANERLLKEAKQTRLSADQGDAKAEVRLGSMYYYGRGVPQDYAEALRWYRKAADQGDAMAQYDVGSRYYYGQGVSQDYAEALRWYRKAADQGDARAQCGLGSMYYYGQGTQQDRAEAANWYRQAADQGQAKAQYDLGYMYYYGQGVQENRAEADRWYHKAADQGYENAQLALGLRRRGLSTWGKISLSTMFLGYVWILQGPRLSRQSLRNRQQRTLTLVALLGLVYVGLSLYQVFAAFGSVSAVNAFNFAKSLVIGVSIAMCISIFGPKSAKHVVGISGGLFVGINLLAMTHHDLRHLAMTGRGFLSLDGLLLGISIPTAMFLWLANKKSTGEIDQAGGPVE